MRCQRHKDDPADAQTSQKIKGLSYGERSGFMKNEKLYDAISDIREEFIEEAEHYKF